MKKNISEDEGRLLLKLARESIHQEFDKHDDDFSSIIREACQDVFKQNRGVFVSLHQNGELKGCIGTIEPVTSLLEGVIDNAKHAAFHDTRFKPLSFKDLEDTKIEVSVLTRPEKIEYKDGMDLIGKIRPDLDGVIIKKGSHSATFLPQVWKQLKKPENFLQQLCLKAGLQPDEWKTGSLVVSTYQVQLFEENE
jgi:AmmeMemoRadiSam system protein A